MTGAVPLRSRLVTTFGLGHLRPAPGTWGSLPPIVLTALLVALGHGPAVHPWLYHALLLAILACFGLACIVGGDEAEARSIRKDPSHVVADETAGQCIPLMLLPAAAWASPGVAAFTLFFAFIAFRVLDIVKPAPARQIQSLPGGWGILADDLVAGLYAAIILQVVTRVVL